MTQFRVGYLEGISKCSDNFCSLGIDNYDLLITASSWDSRSVAITEANDLKANYAFLLTYTHNDNEGLQDNNDIILEKFLKKKCKHVKTITHNSRQIEELWMILLEYIKAVYLKIGHSIRVCLDLTSFPRYCALATLAILIKAGLARHVTYIYSEGIYEHSESPELVFHEGKWKAIPIPYFEAHYDLNKKTFYLLSVGFEGTSTMRVISRDDPDRVSILFPNPGVKPEYVIKAKEENAELIDEYMVPSDQIIDASAGDAIEAWEKLHRNNLERPESENTFYLCCGTKPHSLALALHAMCNNYATVLYYVPDAHKAIKVKPAGKFWRYDIKDLSALP